jgi:hypothetical protein
MSGKTSTAVWRIRNKSDEEPDPSVHHDVDPEALFTFMLIRILILIKVTRICDHWSTDPPRLHFEHLRLHGERPQPSLTPFCASTALKILTYDADPDPAFHNNRKKGIKTRKEAKYTVTR